MLSVKKVIFFCLMLFCYGLVFPNILFDEGVPGDIRVEVSRLYRESGMDASFLIEVHGANDLLIISQDGYIRRLPLSEVTGRDIFIVMETMMDHIPSDETQEYLSEGIELFNEEEFAELEKRLLKERMAEKEKKREFSGSIKINENNEFFPWAESGSRFSAALFISSQENWGGGLQVSAAAAFLKLGFTFTKGSNLKFQDDLTVPWESYSLYLMVDLFRYRRFFVSGGFKVELYDTRGRLFEREFFTFSASQKIGWFEIGTVFNVSPSIVELGLFGQKYRMDQWNFTIFSGFLF